MRLNKVLALKGICSRREADKLISKNQVLINGENTSPGYIVQSGDEIEVQIPTEKEAFKFLFSEEKIVEEFEKIFLILNKQVNIECTCNTNIKNNIITYLRKNDEFKELEKKYKKKNNSELRLFHVGRLDKNSRGLILLTNDGETAQRLTHPKYEHEKEYLVTVNKDISDSFINKLSAGVEISRNKKIDKVKTLACKVKKINSKTFKIILTQGYKRQIRQSCKVLGYEVIDLYRFRIGSLSLEENLNLPESKFKLIDTAIY